MYTADVLCSKYGIKLTHERVEELLTNTTESNKYFLIEAGRGVEVLLYLQPPCLQSPSPKVFHHSNSC